MPDRKIGRDVGFFVVEPYLGNAGFRLLIVGMADGVVVIPGRALRAAMRLVVVLRRRQLLQSWGGKGQKEIPSNTRD